MFTLSISLTNKRDHPSIKTHRNQNLYKNKNRGTQVVKLSVPFLFLFFRRSCRTRAAPAAQERAEQTRMPPPARRKREYGMEESDLLQKVCQPRLDLTNLAVTPGYHSLSWLSSPDLKFPQKISAGRKIARFCTGCRKSFAAFV